MKYKILSFIIGLVFGGIIVFTYGKIFDSNSTNQANNFGPMGGQFSGSGRFMDGNGSGRFMDREDGQERFGTGGFVNNENGNMTSSGRLEEESGFDRNFGTGGIE